MVGKNNKYFKRHSYSHGGIGMLFSTEDIRFPYRPIKELEKAGFNPVSINKKSFFELEDDLHLGHYKISSSSSDRLSHISLSTSSRSRIEKNIRYIFER